MGELVRLFFSRVIAISLLTATSCSLILDADPWQCSTDADCVSFGDHLSCLDGVCGMGPPGCYAGDPATPEQFANRCTAATTKQFDHCNRLGLCDDHALSSAMAFTEPPIGGIVGSTVIVPRPTINCADAAPAQNIIYVTGSTNLPPLIEAVQPLLDAATPPYTVVFAPQTSCKGVASIYDQDVTKHLIKDVTNNWAFYYKKDLNNRYNQTYCLLDPTGNTVDVGESDVYPLSCGYSAMPDVADYPGPILTITFVVPAGSRQEVISAEAAHLVFGAGGKFKTDDGKQMQVEPWIDPNLYFIRSSGTGTVQLLSRAIDLNPGSWWGFDRLSAINLATSMETVDRTKVENTIGILSSDFADRYRDNLRILAFQQKSQRYGYFPDSTATSSDKANVRDGHYPIWGAIHFLAATANGVPASDKARALILQFTVPKLDEMLVTAIIKAGFVPPCAMKVTHGSEVGPLVSSFQPGFISCGCFFDQQVNGSSSCQACRSSSECPSTAKACNYGFCEKQ